jgi:hypothetical protein
MSCGSSSVVNQYYQKASGKPLALAMGMNTVVALATLNKFVAKSLSPIFCDKVES